MKTTTTLPVVGMKYHDFAHLHDQHYASLIGSTVYLSLDADNEAEANAVKVIHVFSTLGYISSAHRASVASYMADDELIDARIIGYDEERHCLLAEADFSGRAEVKHKERRPLEGWHSEVPVFHHCPAYLKYRDSRRVLSHLVRTGSDWSNDMEACLRYAEENAWLDMSGEMQQELALLIEALLTDIPGYHQAAVRLEGLRERLASESSLRRRTDALQALARHPHVTALAQLPEPALQQYLADFPDTHLAALRLDPARFLTHIWYERLPARQLDALLTLAALHLAVSHPASPVQSPSDNPSPASFCSIIADNPSKDCHIIEQEIRSACIKARQLAEYVKQAQMDGYVDTRGKNGKQIYHILKEHFGVEFSYSTWSNYY